MKLINKYENINFPAWALCALVNGDYTGLTDDEIKQFDDFQEDWQKVTREENGTHFWQETTEESYFTHYPEFGLACDCYNMTIYIWGN